MTASVRDEVAGALGSLAVVALVFLLLAPVTPPITSYDGWGFDGLRYREIVLALRGEDVTTYIPYAYRVGVPAIVAALPYDVRTGFLLVNVVASLATGPLLYTLLRTCGATRAASALAVAWWSVLPMSLRYTLAYPTTLDASGFALLVAGLVLALQRRPALFAVALAIGVTVRENILAAAVLLWRSPLARAALALAPAVAALLALRAVVPAAGIPQASLLATQLLYLASGPEPIARYAGALALSLGLLPFVPLLVSGAVRAWLRARPAWTAYLVVTLVLALVGGRDHDRFAVWLVPALAALTFAAGSALFADPRRAALLTGAHILAARPFLPGDVDANELLIAWMRPERIPLLASLTAVAVAAAFVAIRSLPLERRTRSLA